MTEPWHGTLDGYNNHDCRCDLCRHANTVWMRGYRARVQSGTVPKHVHGTNNGYTTYGCRCKRCSAAHHEVAVEYRERRRRKTLVRRIV